LNDTVHLLPPITQRGRRKKFCFNLNFCRPLSRLEPTDRTQWPTTHRAPTRKPGRGAGPWQSRQWPTSRLLPMRAVQSHALGSINRTPRAPRAGGRRRRRKQKQRRERGRTERREKPRGEKNIKKNRGKKNRLREEREGKKKRRPKHRKKREKLETGRKLEKKTITPPDVRNSCSAAWSRRP